jgi:hypothetical protein
MIVLHSAAAAASPRVERRRTLRTGVEPTLSARKRSAGHCRPPHPRTRSPDDGGRGIGRFGVEEASTNGVRLRRVTEDVRSATIGCRSAFVAIHNVTDRETSPQLDRKN